MDDQEGDRLIMARRPYRCDRTGDLLAWEPPVRDIIPLFEAAVLGINDPYARLMAGMKQAIEESGLSRAEIAQAMSAWTGQVVSEHALNAMLSQARESHIPNVLRFQGLARATQDARLSNLLVNPLGLIAVPARFAKVIELAQVREERERLGREERKLKRVIGG